MKFKLSFCGLVVFFFFFSHSYAQGWSTKPRTLGTYNSWRKTHQFSKFSGSKSRWEKDRRHKISKFHRNKPKHRNKRMSIYNTSYWGYSGLGYQRIEYESAQKRVVKLVPSDMSEESESLPEKKKEFAKPQIETVGEEMKITAESDYEIFLQKSDGITLMGSEGNFQIENNVRVKSLTVPRGSIRIYSSD